MAYVFNGSSQYLGTSVSPFSGVNEPITLACWLRTTNLNQEGALVGISNSSLSTGAAYILRFDNGPPNGTIIATKYNGTAASNRSTNPNVATVNTWNHAAAVFVSDSSKTAYINSVGVTDNTTSLSDTNQTFNSVSIGVQRGGGSLLSRYFNGEIAEVGIWSAALSADEIASLSKGFACDRIRPQSLVFYAPLVRNLMDARGGLTITNTNSATVSTHPRIYY